MEANESVYLAIGPGQLVGINTTSPRQTLTVAGDANVAGILYVGQQSFTNVDASGNLVVGRNLTVSNNVLFASNLTSRVGINTTNPDSTFTVVGNASIDGSTFYVDAGNNRVGIGSVSPTQPLHVEGQCVAWYTDISLANGTKRKIVDVREGDYVQSLDEETGKIVVNKVKGLLDMDVKPVFELMTASGKAINTTGNYPYLVKLYTKMQMNSKATAQGGQRYQNYKKAWRLLRLTIQLL